MEVAVVYEALSQTPETLLRKSEGVVVDEVQCLPSLRYASFRSLAAGRNNSCTSCGLAFPRVARIT